MNALRVILVLSLCLAMIPLTAVATTPALIGIQQFGGTGADGNTYVAVDGSGNVLIVGSFSGTVDFGGGPLVSAGGTDIVLMSYSAAGEYQWSQRFGGTGADVPAGVAVDPSGNVLITGQYTGAVDFGTGPLSASSHVFLAKYAPNGPVQWTQAIAGGWPGVSFTARNIAIDSFGNVFVSIRWFDGTGTFSCNPSNPQSVNFRVTKYNSSGAFQWDVCPPFNGSNTELTFAVDLSGSLFLTGAFQFNVLLAGQNLVSAGGLDIFLAKYSSSGAGLWARRFGSSSSEYARAISLDESGNALITGYFPGTIDFGGGVLVTAGLNDIFLCKFDTNGFLVWSERFGGTSSDIGTSVVASNDGVFLFGLFNGTLTLGGDVLVNGGAASDVFVARYANDGSHQWSHAWGVANSVPLTGFASDNTGSALVALAFSGNMPIAGNWVRSAGSSDMLILRYAVEPAEPFITVVDDIGNDQGRMVKVRFEKSGYDNVGSRLPVRHYDVLRRDDPPPSAAAREAASASTARADGWTQVGTVSAYGEANYGADVPTIGDSTIVQGPYNSVFSVRAATDDPVVFFPSPSASGYSLDNLAPGVPQNLIYSAGHLTWGKPTDADFDFFTVYGNNTNAFASATLIDHTVTPEKDATASPYAYYFATATDFSGNEGKPAMVKVLSGTDGTPLSYVLSVSAYPNPFNPQTTIRCTLPARARVLLAIYDARGAQVKLLMNEDRPGGTFTLQWDGRSDAGKIVSSGVYFARLQSGGEDRSYKLVLQK